MAIRFVLKDLVSKNLDASSITAANANDSVPGLGLGSGLDMTGGGGGAD